jgi:Domain of unknown function (DUF4258)
VADKPIFLSKHAQDMVNERDIDPQWIEQVLQNPVFVEPDPRHPEPFALMRRSRRSAIACFESSIMIGEPKFG